MNAYQQVSGQFVPAPAPAARATALGAPPELIAEADAVRDKIRIRWLSRHPWWRRLRSGARAMARLSRR
ncbi:MAG: hypothetical protein V3S29_09400 [bacterium]